ncbi:MAG: hypothetical protein EBT20_13680 [Alphaproteobacteria bacterium]|nr:hypothetical protein [Alphaproteobacteria bacterium]
MASKFIMFGAGAGGGFPTGVFRDTTNPYYGSNMYDATSNTITVAARHSSKAWYTNIDADSMSVNWIKTPTFRGATDLYSAGMGVNSAGNFVFSGYTATGTPYTPFFQILTPSGTGVTAAGQTSWYGIQYAPLIDTNAGYMGAVSAFASAFTDQHNVYGVSDTLASASHSARYNSGNYGSGFGGTGPSDKLQYANGNFCANYKSVGGSLGSYAGAMNVTYGASAGYCFYNLQQGYATDFAAGKTTSNMYHSFYVYNGNWYYSYCAYNTSGTRLWEKSTGADGTSRDQLIAVNPSEDAGILGKTLAVAGASRTSYICLFDPANGVISKYLHITKASGTTMCRPNGIHFIDDDVVMISIYADDGGYLVLLDVTNFPANGTYNNLTFTNGTGDPFSHSNTTYSSGNTGSYGSTTSLSASYGALSLANGTTTDSFVAT